MLTPICIWGLIVYYFADKLAIPLNLLTQRQVCAVGIDDFGRQRKNVISEAVEDS